jgi:hypothetical protein
VGFWRVGGKFHPDGTLVDLSPVGLGTLVRAGPLISLPGSAMKTTAGQPDAAITRMSLRTGAPSCSLMAQHDVPSVSIGDNPPN